MKKFLILLLIMLVAGFNYAQTGNRQTSVIPKPLSTITSSGEFILPTKIFIKAPGTKNLQQVVTTLKTRLTSATGFPVYLNTRKAKTTIQLSLNTIPDTTLGSEGYKLRVNKTGISIGANEPAGLFYGVQTLIQLFQPEIESKTRVMGARWKINCVQITDKPRFGWRGLMFDVSRHFFTKADVKTYIDQMVRYKFNLLHLHLTDDEGWRIQIIGLPKLTEIGAFNVKKVGYFGTFSAPGPDEPRNYGGFYTQDDIREIVQYAKDRFVNILPEIDVPGHSLAAVASYPDLSCTSAANTYHVRSGEEIMDWSKNTPLALIDNTLCPANEKVYIFLDKVITQVAALFPFEYIHMGGDECPKNFWEKNPEILLLMKREGLKTMEEVQSYFEKRVEKIVESKGKKFMGWDEILEGGIAPNAVVMSWRGIKGGIQAAKMGHNVVMSPTTFSYLDYMQGDSAIEPKVYATLRLNKAYEFEPVPDSVDARFIKGGQANLWTEQVYNMRHAEYMTWPRGMAIAESVWSTKSHKNWDDFARRVQMHFKRLDIASIKYAPSMYDPIFEYSLKPDKGLMISMSGEITGLEMHYSFDNSFPDQFYPMYNAPLEVPKDASYLKVISYRGNFPVGRMITISLQGVRHSLIKN